MSERNDGGAAFPYGVKVIRQFESSVVDYHDPIHEDGMSLRDYFAAHEHTTPIKGTTIEDIAKGFTPEELAEWRYLCADAMLAWRDK